MGEELKDSSPTDITKLFEEHFPYYLALGMTYDQFWRGDPGLVVAYRKAYKIKQEWQNHEAWLQGMYFYEALCDVSPVLHAFAKGGEKPFPYTSEPYSFGDERKKREEEKAQNAGKNFMTQFAIKFNSRR